MSKCSYLDCHVLYLLIKLSLQYWSLGAKKTLYYLKSRHLCGKLIIKFGLYMDFKVFLLNWVNEKYTCNNQSSTMHKLIHSVIKPYLRKMR